MFHIGWPELVLIAAVALILFGPNRLPEIAKAIGKSIQALKKGLQDKGDDTPKP
ncbi:MAG: twin-arginine translocase TatA/TatE family subunit [Elusimicrobia bacterium]|nr:twin-arginine translocase TatA/TatE family subunit [Elusimicrobiota bacterium]